MNWTIAIAERAAVTLREHGPHFTDDAQRNFFWSVCAQIEAHGCVKSLKLRGSERVTLRPQVGKDFRCTLLGSE